MKKNEVMFLAEMDATGDSYQRKWSQSQKDNNFSYFMLS